MASLVAQWQLYHLPMQERAKSFQSYPTLCHPLDCSPSGSSVHGILQARILEWIAMLSSRGSFQPRIELKSLLSPALAGRFFTTGATWEGTVSSIPVPERSLEKDTATHSSVLAWEIPWTEEPGGLQSMGS